MKYYRLDNSVNTKEIGRHFLQATFADKKLWIQDVVWLETNSQILSQT